MNDVLDTIERELTIAVRRSNARRRRRRTRGLFTGIALSVAVTAGVGVAAVTDTPINRLMSGDTLLAQPRGAQRVDLRLQDAGGLGWTVTTYAPRFGGIGMTTAADGLAATPTATARSGFTLAEGLLRGPLAGDALDVVRAGGSRHYLYAGTVDASATGVTVRLGGRLLPATLTSQVVSTPVERPAGLTAYGRKVAERVPDEVRLRTFAVTLVPDELVGRRWVRATVLTTLADGSTHRQRSIRYCVATSCGLRVPRVHRAAGQGRAG